MNDHSLKTGATNSNNSDAAIRRASVAKQMFNDTLGDFALLLEGRFKRRGKEQKTDVIEQAAHAVIESFGQKAVSTGDRFDNTEPLMSLERICTVNNARVRRSRIDGNLSGMEALVAFYGAEREPVALIPTSRKGMECIRFMPQRKEPLTPEFLDNLDSIAYGIYPTLPGTKLNYFQTLLFGWGFVKRNVLEILSFGLLSSLIAMAMPIAYGMVVNYVIADHEIKLLIEITGALIIALLVQAVLRIAGDFSFMRMEAKLSVTLHAAMIDRALRLTPAALRTSTTVILATQMETVEKLRRSLTKLSSTFSLALIQCLVALSLAMFYSLPAALTAGAMSLLLLLSNCYIGWKQFKAIYEGERMDIVVLAFLYDLIRLIPVLRGMRAERLAFVQWGQNFLAFQSRLLRSSFISNRAPMFEAAWEFLIYIFCFTAIAYSGSTDALSLGAAVAFVSALSRLIGSVKEMSHSLLGAAKMLPMAKLALPFIEHTLEQESSGGSTPVLKGNIEVSRVNFSYNSARVLADVSLEIPAGAYVGIVGLSGSGKSSLIRMILGLETPNSGAIYYDGHDVKLLNKQHLRRQIGAVLQHARLFGGSIFENIRGASGLHIDDVKEIADIVGLTNDLRNMPMGLHTPIGDSGVGLSGGQVQRVLLARSLASRPRILILDEATSALDPASEEHFLSGLSSLGITRIVSTHRLETLRNTDMIVVMHQGTVAEKGNFSTLATSGGIFSKLLSARSQEELL